MRLFEYEAKQILGDSGIPVPEGIVCRDPSEAAGAAGALGGDVVVKGQVLAGGRRKAGGVRFARSSQEAMEVAQSILSMTIGGEPVRKVLVERRLNIQKEYYLSVTIDQVDGCALVMASSEGGVDIEEVAKGDPGKVVTQRIDVQYGMRSYHCRDVLTSIGIPRGSMNSAMELLAHLYEIFRKYDAELVEVNPLVVLDDGATVAADAKMIINDNALFRQKWLEKSRERYSNEQEYQAAQYGLNYVRLEGDIGVLCTGAGLTMATLDLIKMNGGRPANFLESGGANYRNAYHGLNIVLNDPQVKVLLINIFGLVSRADVISRGLADALKELKPEKPIVARIRGTGEEEGRRIFETELGLKPFDDTEDAVREAVRIAGGLK